MDIKTASTMSNNRTFQVSESIEDSTEYESKFNSSKINPEKTVSFQQTETSQTSKKESNDLIRFKFEWKEGGNDIKIAGSFLENWQKQEPMKKNLATNFYEFELDIPKGIHQFKFIIENKWKCSKDYKISKDKSDNYNNEIDLTDINNININNNNYTNKIKNKKSNKDKIDYPCDIPLKTDAKKASNLPWNYKANINFGYKYINCNNNNLIENDTFKSIATTSHDKLSHIVFNNDNYFGINHKNEKNKNYLRIATTQRNRHKFLTVVYFSPK